LVGDVDITTLGVSRDRLLHSRPKICSVVLVIIIQ
jgi:hypothetical protein